MTTETNYTYIGRAFNSICSTWFISGVGREIKQIHFYTKDRGVIMSTNSGWICKDNTNYNDYNRVDDITVVGEVTSHLASVNVGGRIKKGGNFTVNLPKEYSYDEPSCALYLEIDNKYIKLVEETNMQEIQVSTYDMSARTYFYKKAVLEITENPQHEKSSPEIVRTFRTYLKYGIGRREENTDVEKARLDAVCDMFKANSIFTDRAEISRIINCFDLQPRTTKLADSIVEKVRKAHSDETFEKEITL